MNIEEFFSQTAWRLRAYLGSGADEARVTLEEAFAVFWEAEHQAARHQLPQYAQSRYLQCAAHDEAGDRCQHLAVTPPLYGFLSEQQRPPFTRQQCRLFLGGLCAQHIPHLLVPLTTWWPDEEGTTSMDREAIYGRTE